MTDVSPILLSDSLDDVFVGVLFIYFLVYTNFRGLDFNI